MNSSSPKHKVMLWKLARVSLNLLKYQHWPELANPRDKISSNCPFPENTGHHYMHLMVLFPFSSAQSWILTSMPNVNVPFISLFLMLDFQEIIQGIFYMQLFMLVYLVKVCWIPNLVAITLVKKCLLQQSAWINNQHPGLLKWVNSCFLVQ